VTDLIQAIRDAHERIEPFVRRTPAELSRPLSRMANGEVFLKLECFQETGTFKLRGATNRLLELDEEARRRGVVAASSGNHGLAVAAAAARLSLPCIVFVPENASHSKVAGILGRGVELRHHGEDCVETEAFARRYADELGMTYVSPYNDPLVVAGQGTVGRELGQQAPRLDAVFVSVGGGGLVSGVGTWLKSVRPSIEVIACSPEASPTMHCSLEAGRVVLPEIGPTLSDGTAGGLEKGAITLPICQQVVDRSVLVTEDAIAAAMRLMMARHHVLVEGAAGVAVAGWAKERERLQGKRVAIILCGANVSLDVLRDVLAAKPE
jgi:threonine dehydratase